MQIFSGHREVSLRQEAYAGGETGWHRNRHAGRGCPKTETRPGFGISAKTVFLRNRR